MVVIRLDNTSYDNSQGPSYNYLLYRVHICQTGVVYLLVLKSLTRFLGFHIASIDSEYTCLDFHIVSGGLPRHCVRPSLL